MLPFEISPSELKAKLDSGQPVTLVDVREPQEYQLARLDGSDLVPMRTVPAAVNRLEEQAEETLLVVYCHHGVRSLQVVNWLREQGIESCQSLSGGIDRWSREIDPRVPQY